MALLKKKNNTCQHDYIVVDQWEEPNNTTADYITCKMKLVCKKCGDILINSYISYNIKR